MATISPAIGSARLWPKGCPSSASLSDILTQMKMATEVTISVRELKASERRAIEPDMMPVTSFMIKRRVLNTIPTTVAL